MFVESHWMATHGELAKMSSSLQVNDCRGGANHEQQMAHVHGMITMLRRVGVVVVSWTNNGGKERHVSACLCLAMCIE